MVANASTVGAIAGNIIATIMVSHIANAKAALCTLHAPPHHICARNGLNAGKPEDCSQVTDHAAALASTSAV
jgi:hypothetical protein